ncbi:hypothetical protein EMIHUDRAFT_243933 [Emiliania huxleyi CCMP1516]|uniref:Uncharacterized protein n=2 Tax=Emiliania huxleyi TaxID=2903 RepID=A0A0D3J293_EMIH1|nr:hypothetical protein EMIHUDRAFT_243933 [Emiliania huxleyi CCMP1516]EOD17628.1 hypothetical protein EMIHUDRAFT_243933 [Emiliania huxleyi CCMP1516]|eukprot:XP_005770057.1 hypothetical protein EMIHUDRAFT_243933 [Emiliania huxleyi CCMP1516]
MAFRRHFSRVGSAERCTETIFTDHQRQVCDYALVYAEKKNDGEAPYSVSFTATQSGDVIVQLHPHSQLERALAHTRWRARQARIDAEPGTEGADDDHDETGSQPAAEDLETEKIAVSVATLDCGPVSTAAELLMLTAPRLLAAGPPLAGPTVEAVSCCRCK